MPIYLQCDGIDGDVTAAGHEKWVEVQSCQFGVGRSVSNPTGRGVNREASAPSVSEVVVVVPHGDSSVKFFQASLHGEGKEVKIHFCKTEKDNLEPFLELTLSDCLITGFSCSSGGDAPTESLSLNFTKIEYKHTGMDKENKPASPEAVTWDLAQAKES